MCKKWDFHMQPDGVLEVLEVVEVDAVLSFGGFVYQDVGVR